MDPNFHYPNNSANHNLGQGYFYDTNHNLPQSPYHVNPLSQRPQHPQYSGHSQQPQHHRPHQSQAHPQAQPYYLSSHPQTLAQNHPQNYQNRAYPQSYQPPLQQLQQPIYQQPVQLHPQPQNQLDAGTVVIPMPRPRYQPATVQSQRGHQPSQLDSDIIEAPPPRRPIHSSPPQAQYGQQTPRASQQARPQVPKPVTAHKNTPKSSQRPQHAAQLPQQHLGKDSRSAVGDIQHPTPVTPSYSKKEERQVASTSSSNTPKMPRQNQSRVLKAVEVNATSRQPAVKSPGHRDLPIDVDELEPDYPSLLCVLADDYLEAARKLPAPTEEYYTLIATTLGCLESVLANFKVPPLREAQVSLRYAQILYAETENYDEAETILAKAIELCERHKFIDLKYEMQLLLSKVLYESKPKAALRDIQRMIDDIEAYSHTVWLYIFRFQHAMFSLASSAPGEIHGAVVQLQKIRRLAHENSDDAVFAFAAALEALLHLSGSSQEAVTASQTALAQAQSSQLNTDVQGIPQLTILMKFIDLACSIRGANIGQIAEKLAVMLDILRRSVSDANWREDGLIYVPVGTKAVAGMQLHGNGNLIKKNGKYHIPFSWLGKKETMALGNLFSAASSAYKNGSDGGKAEKYADSGLSVLKALGMPSLKAGYRESRRQLISRRLAEAEFSLLLVFLQCSKGLWHEANHTLDKVHVISQELGNAFPVNMKSCLLYLRGAVLQGTGDLAGALQVYQSLSDTDTRNKSPSGGSRCSNQISNSYHAESDITRQFSILAMMNSTLIIRNPAHPQNKRLSSLIKDLDTAVQKCGNPYIKSHYALVEAILSTNQTAKKNSLGRSMAESKAIGNAQTTALILVYMQDQMYKGSTDDQALKCARAASNQTGRWGQPMWMHVATALEAQALDFQGRVVEAKEKMAAAEVGWQMLPNGIKGIADEGTAGPPE
ncbi:hypothetical protein AYO21_07855 [Fonsecaea monophora]|uniref:Cohesin loading factor n=1 Tax=Fonsecaea monophora TaxID=254056 RepID=A0A177F0S5_9EURO|nr:hypothetical protein AYO21_07855 [Fonsecaea monophora]KAH0846780.1 75k gamma secalin [Fonsecaea pedrosoi]OAG37883.1 hypothetical protein AYO21_07855 [Fonsecaea monophora]